MTDHSLSKPDTLETLLAQITPDIYQELRTAVELGRWPNGDRITDDQRDLCLQAVIAYDTSHHAPEARVGYVRPRDKTPGKGASNG